jgi:hypothetical protein
MTLGPIVALIPYTEKVKGWFSDLLSVFGRVPMFYYLLHIPLIHISSLLVNLIQQGKSLSEFYATAPFTFLPEENRWSLLSLYLVFIVDVALLYFACKWYYKIKQKYPNGILRFI